MIGKRKRDAVVVRRERQDNGNDGGKGNNDVLRKYFESVFEPLPESDIKAEIAEESSEEGGPLSDGGSEFSGFSDSEDARSPSPVTVEVISHGGEPAQHAKPSSLTEFKAFMSSKPPKEVPQQRQVESGSSEEDELETRNLKHDLDLQRLLKESHLFERGSQSMPVVGSATGKQRHRATDLRMRDLGAGTGSGGRESMPMAHGKGIEGKKKEKEGKRREEAREHGIVLEKKQRKATREGKRERAVDAPGLGRFRGGTLTLSKRDVKGMQGPARSSGSRRRKS